MSLMFETWVTPANIGSGQQIGQLLQPDGCNGKWFDCSITSRPWQRPDAGAKRSMERKALRVGHVLLKKARGWKGWQGSWKLCDGGEAQGGKRALSEFERAISPPLPRTPGACTFERLSLRLQRTLFFNRWIFLQGDEPEPRPIASGGIFGAVFLWSLEELGGSGRFVTFSLIWANGICDSSSKKH